MIDTHDLIVDFGKHAGERWTRVPVAYLRWMVNAGHGKANIAQAELDRRGISAKDRNLEITGHAIDGASLRCRRIWHEDANDGEGLHAWLLRVCEEGLTEQSPDDEGRVYYKGMKLIFKPGEMYPILLTVMRDKRANGKGE